MNSRLAVFALALFYIVASNSGSNSQENCESLWLKRNSIFAEAGLCFKTARAIETFGNNGCRFHDLRELPLSSVARDRISQLSRAETQLRCADPLVTASTPKPLVPIVIGGESDFDACGGNGVVFGLDPHGDGFLAVKGEPNLRGARINKLFNGEQVYICQERGDWLGVVYTKSRQDCNVSTPWPLVLPYTGPCGSGWSIEVLSSR